MKTFEEYLAMEKYREKSKDNARIGRQKKRQLTRAQRRQRRYTMALWTAVTVWAVLCIALLVANLAN